MSRRERVEDLGVLTEKLQGIIDHDLFHIFERLGCRRKDFVEHFETLSETKKDDLLHEIAYGVDQVNDLVLDCWSIARGDEDV